MANAPESIGSHQLLKALSANGPPGPDACPKAVASQARLWALHDYKQLIAEELLFVLWMVDPESFAFYYVVGEQIAIVLPPSDPTLDRVPSPGRSRRGSGRGVIRVVVELERVEARLRSRQGSGRVAESCLSDTLYQKLVESFHTL
jgi:hypothetical protein